MDFHGPDDPVYTISVAARLLGVTPQFLRQIEGEGLVSPKRTDSNIRLYSDKDLKLIARVIYLWRDCGINPQGIRVILAMEEGEMKPGENDGAALATRKPQRRLSLENKKQDSDSGTGSHSRSTGGFVKGKR